MNTLVSVAHTGGQGKSTLAQLLYLASKKLGQNHKLAAADYLDDTGHSKLGKLYPDIVEEYGVGATLTAARTENDPNAAIRYWDKLGYVFLQGGYVIDIGANVFSSILDWSSDRHLKKLMEKKDSPRVDFFCICKPELHPIDDIANLVASVIKRNSFRLGKIFVVQNEVGGSFQNSRLREKVDKAAGDMTVNYLTLPKCQSEIWPAMEKNGISIAHALEMEEDELVSKLNVDLWTASSGSAELHAWFDYNVRMLRDAGVFALEGPKLTKKAS